MKKRFPLRVVLTVTTGRLLTEPKGPHDNGIGAVYEILNHITSDDLFTHQLPRAGDAARPWLLKCFPELEAVNDFVVRLDELLAADASTAVNRWLANVRQVFPRVNETYEIEPLPDGWIRMDPMIEAEAMVGDKTKIISIEV